MGFIKKIFGGIFALFGSILKVFGIGKKGEFYMELDDSTPAASAPVSETTTQTPAPASQEMTSTPEPRVLSQNTDSGTVVPTPAVETQPKVPTVTNFATDYLVNPRINNSPRRRPGPSVSPFKEMVRDMSRKSPSMG